MIQIYTGVPGSGKSYKMVLDLADFLSKNPDVEVISNIRNLKLPHTDFEAFLDELFPGLKLVEKVEKFFTYEHQQQLNEKFGGPILYVLDECQLYFPRRTSLPNTEAYLQRHRHLGHYIYLATQSLRLINSNFIPLIEIEYHAARRTISFFGEIHYKEKSPQSKEIIRKITLMPKQKIFALYQSFEASEIKKPRPMLLKLFILPLLLTPFLYLFYDKFLNVKEKSFEAQTPVPIESAAEAEAVFQNQELVSLQSQVQVLKQDLEMLNTQLEEKERVFLPVVQSGKRKLTVDPETGAVVEVSRIKGRKVICVNQGLSCYYDRPVAAKVRIPSDSFGSSLPPLSYFPFTMKSGASTPAKKDDYSFITADMVPRN